MDLDYNPSRKSLVKNKWVATTAGIWIQCTAGSIYIFTIYSSVLKSSQDYDQSTLDTISVCKDLGSNVGTLSGVLYSSAAGRVGPWVVLVAGAIQSFAGYFLMWLTVTGVLPRPPVAVMCLYMLLAAHAANVVTGVHNFRDYSGTIVGIMKVFSVLLLSPIFIAIKAQREKSYWMLKSLLEHNQLEDERDLLDERTTSTRQDLGEYHEISNGNDLVTNDDRSESRGDVTLFQAFGTISFWFLFSTTACAMGSGLTTVNNMSQIGESLGYTSLEINTLVSLWSIWNFLGRFGAGLISDYFLHAKGCPRPLVMGITLATMSIGYLVIALGFPGALYIGSILVGICYGSQWSLMPTIASDLFGNTHLGTIFNTITIACPVGSYLLSVRVVGYIYDREAPEFEKTCIGTHCFKMGFIIMASVAFLGSLTALALFLRTRSFYKNVICPRVLHSIRGSKIRVDM